MDPATFLSGPARQILLESADGDGRKLLTALETLHAHHTAASERPEPLEVEDLATILQRPSLRYDKKKRRALRHDFRIYQECAWQ
ncbi:MAG: hypothetical protein HC902_13540 [Calothrix sp. SM1_5_4]|nr:hypothetical protein [Calothrix sp. SM1_5_4]